MPILAGAVDDRPGLLHIALLKDLRHPANWAVALAVGIVGFLSNLAIALVGGLVIWWLVLGDSGMAESPQWRWLRLTCPTNQQFREPVKLEHI